ncbi:glutamate receptor: ionotropic kainate 2-like protein [Leptotrombidium deliense]|uniref:Glutamate receptor: ionotropic kainate 2-like protein n=1 Tax=Leptotrombidium deliense TaxID=299467 RepID=A0A443SC51_9ACAR|nr:glutamate receptor: ionotropic kainate 2-like protein [Leptotrombidium deliense]
MFSMNTRLFIAIYLRFIKMCDLVEDGVWAIFGPQVPAVGWLVRSCAHHLHIPHILLSWDYRTPKSLFKRNINQSDFTLNLYPDPSSLSKAFMDLVIYREWKEFTLIYEENEGSFPRISFLLQTIFDKSKNGKINARRRHASLSKERFWSSLSLNTASFAGLIKLKDLLRISTVKEKVKITIRQHHSSQSYKKIFKYAQKRGEKNFVLSVSSDKVHEILYQVRIYVCTAFATRLRALKEKRRIHS